MYSNIFRDIHIDDRRMRKHVEDIVEKVSASQVNSIDAMQSNTTMSLQEYIALWERLNELRNTQQPPPVRDPVREAQEQQRPLPERDRPEVREPRERDERRDDYFLRQYHGGGW